MNTYRLLKLLIERNRYEYEDMYSKLDLFMAMDRITEEEYLELTGMLVAPVVPEPEPEVPAEPDPEQPVDPEEPVVEPVTE